MYKYELPTSRLSTYTDGQTDTPLRGWSKILFRVFTTVLYKYLVPVFNDTTDEVVT